MTTKNKRPSSASEQSAPPADPIPTPDAAGRMYTVTVRHPDRGEHREEFDATVEVPEALDRTIGMAMLRRGGEREEWTPPAQPETPADQ